MKEFLSLAAFYIHRQNVNIDYDNHSVKNLDVNNGHKPPYAM